MTCPAPYIHDFRRTLMLIVMSIAVIISVSIALPVFRHPVASPTDPLANLQIKRELLAGSDALLDRGVIPPHRPDWIVMDCGKESSSNSGLGRLRRSACDMSAKSVSN